MSVSEEDKENSIPNYMKKVENKKKSRNSALDVIW